MTLSLSCLINHFFASPFFRSHEFFSVSFRRIMSGNQDMYRRIIVVHRMFHSFIFPVFCRIIFRSINNKIICMCPRQPKRNLRKKSFGVIRTGVSVHLRSTNGNAWMEHEIWLSFPLLTAPHLLLPHTQQFRILKIHKERYRFMQIAKWHGNGRANYLSFFWR